MTAALQPIRGIVTQYANYVIHQHLLRRFAPKVSFRFERGHYIVKTAESWGELEGVLRLRYDVFHREVLNLEFPLGMDVDRFDAAADHLIIVDKRSGATVGSYRLLSSCVAAGFYSQTEFRIDDFLRLPGTKLELSRACIHRDFRNGQVIHLLWRGLMEYAQAVNARFLFGCASVKATDTATAAALCRHFRAEGKLGDAFSAEPLPAFRVPGLEDEVRGDRVLDGLGELVPPLLLAYFRAGAKVYGAPALDRAFRCLDFFTVLRLAEMSESYGRRYSSPALG